MERLARFVLTPLLLRLGLCFVFIHAGMSKLGSENEWGAAWGGDAVDLSAFVKILVAWGEFIGGLAVGLGFLSRLASIGLVAIMVGAIATVTGAMGFAHYQINVLLIIMGLSVVMLGSGPVSLDRLLWGPRNDVTGGSR